MKRFKSLASAAFAVALFVSASVSVRAQGSGYNSAQLTNFTVTGSGIVIQQNSLILYHEIIWTPTSASACSVTVDSSSDGVTWSTGGVITAQTCTSGGNSTIVNVQANYIRVTVASLTGTGVQIQYEGWAYNPSGGSSGVPSVNVSNNGSALTPVTTAVVLNFTSGCNATQSGGTFAIACTNGSGTVSNCASAGAFFYAASTGTTATCNTNLTDGGSAVGITVTNPVGGNFTVNTGPGGAGDGNLLVSGPSASTTASYFGDTSYSNWSAQANNNAGCDWLATAMNCLTYNTTQTTAGDLVLSPLASEMFLNSSVNGVAGIYLSYNTGLGELFTQFKEPTASGSYPWSFLLNGSQVLGITGGGGLYVSGATSGTGLSLSNGTASTSGTWNSSPIASWGGTYYTGSASAADTWTVQNVLNAAAGSVGISNCVENSSSVVTLTTASPFPVPSASSNIYLSGLTTCTWLNSETISSVTSISTSASTITFTDPTSHGTQTSHSDTGTIGVGASVLNFAHSGSPSVTAQIQGPYQLNFCTWCIGTTGYGFGMGNIESQPAIFAGPNGAFSIYACGDSANTLFMACSIGGTISSSAAQTDINPAANSPVYFGGTVSTSTTNPATGASSLDTMDATSGTQVLFEVGTNSSQLGNSSGYFGPSSGTANFIGAFINPEIDQTSSASGNYIALGVYPYVAAALGSTNYLAAFGTASTNGQGATLTNKATIDPSGNLVLSGGITASFTNAVPYTISASSTPAINLNNGSLQTITLNANAVATVSNLASGSHLTIQICQPGSGGPYTWTWPTAIHGGVTIGTTASDCSMQSFDSYNGTTMVPESTGVINVAP